MPALNRAPLDIGTYDFHISEWNTFQILEAKNCNLNTLCLDAVRPKLSAHLQGSLGISGSFRQWLMASEIRAIVADDLLLSPHNRDYVGDDGSVGFHFTWQLAEVEVKLMALPQIEKVLEPFDA